MEIKKLFLRPKPVDHFLMISDKLNFTKKICERTKLTWSHGYELQGKFEKAGLIRTKKQGRKNIIKLTKEGLLLQSYFKELIRLLEE